MDTRIFRVIGLSTALLFLAACSSVPPIPIPADNPPLPVVRENIPAHQDQAVVWGGQILAVAVKQSNTEVTVLGKPLDSYSEPVTTDQSEGRFLAHFSGFRDPAVFAVGRNLTIAGTIAGSDTRKIGDYAYVYPVVNVSQYHLWPVTTTRTYDTRDYWWYDPWYPWYPGYYPYYYPPPQKLPSPKK
ncbi:MAG: Slp/YeaY family lipoprotein [Gammaproteobacteria bacterium]|nr:Slp/YeaY family lipoprotein [Gammaproteobacteria bacterium]